MYVNGISRLRLQNFFVSVNTFFFVCFVTNTFWYLGIEEVAGQLLVISMAQEEKCKLPVNIQALSCVVVKEKEEVKV